MSTAIRFLAATIILFQTVSGLVADDVWLTDPEEATKMAVDQDKDLLLLFTGSDWCPPCIKLETEIFSKPEFLEEAKRQFVFLVFDFPREKQLPDELAAQNKKWAQRFGVERYPTVIVLDKKQRPFGITGYRDGGVEEYLGQLGEFTQKRKRRDEALAKAKDLKGTERAKMLDQALTEMEQSCLLYTSPSPRDATLSRMPSSA